MSDLFLVYFLCHAAVRCLTEIEMAGKAFHNDFTICSTNHERQFVFSSLYKELLYLKPIRVIRFMEMFYLQDEMLASTIQSQAEPLPASRCHETCRNVGWAGPTVQDADICPLRCPAPWDFLRILDLRENIRNRPTMVHHNVRKTNPPLFRGKRGHCCFARICEPIRQCGTEIELMIA
jgi:hypothetical protein